MEGAEEAEEEEEEAEAEVKQTLADLRPRRRPPVPDSITNTAIPSADLTPPQASTTSRLKGPCHEK